MIQKLEKVQEYSSLEFSEDSIQDSSENSESEDHSKIVHPRELVEETTNFKAKIRRIDSISSSDQR